MKFFDAEEKMLIKASEKDARKVEKQIRKGIYKEDIDFKKALITTAKERKSQSISLRLAPSDLRGIKEIAAEKGLPYQTLISSILHQYIRTQGLG